jgi:DivIVA domain-containing protein
VFGHPAAGNGLRDVSEPEHPADAELVAAEQHDADDEGATVQLRTLTRVQEPVSTEIRDVSFSVALRGYDRAEVDEYVEHVNHLIAELEVRSSPQNAVKAALDRVGEQTAGVLQQAREAAEELTATALAESDHATRRARVEAKELLERAHKESQDVIDRANEEADQLREHAQARAVELDERIADAHREHKRVIEELHVTAAGIEAFAAEAAAEERASATAESARGPDGSGAEQAALGERTR